MNPNLNIHFRSPTHIVYFTDKYPVYIYIKDKWEKANNVLNLPIISTDRASIWGNSYCLSFSELNYYVCKNSYGEFFSIYRGSYPIESQTSWDYVLEWTEKYMQKGIKIMNNPKHPMCSEKDFFSKKALNFKEHNRNHPWPQGYSLFRHCHYFIQDDKYGLIDTVHLTCPYCYIFYEEYYDLYLCLKYAYDQGKESL